jgi:hypothetical protein
MYKKETMEDPALEPELLQLRYVLVTLKENGEHTLEELSNTNAFWYDEVVSVRHANPYTEIKWRYGDTQKNPGNIQVLFANQEWSEPVHGPVGPTPTGDLVPGNTKLPGSPSKLARFKALFTRLPKLKK